MYKSTITKNETKKNMKTETVLIINTILKYQ